MGNLSTKLQSYFLSVCIILGTTAVPLYADDIQEGTIGDTEIVDIPGPSQDDSGVESPQEEVGSNDGSENQDGNTNTEEELEDSVTFDGSSIDDSLTQTTANSNSPQIHSAHEGTEEEHEEEPEVSSYDPSDDEPYIEETSKDKNKLFNTAMMWGAGVTGATSLATCKPVPGAKRANSLYVANAASVAYMLSEVTSDDESQGKVDSILEGKTDQPAAYEKAALLSEENQKSAKDKAKMKKIVSAAWATAAGLAAFEKIKNKAELKKLKAEIMGTCAKAVSLHQIYYSSGSNNTSVYNEAKKMEQIALSKLQLYNQKYSDYKMICNPAAMKKHAEAVKKQNEKLFAKCLTAEDQSRLTVHLTKDEQDKLIKEAQEEKMINIETQNVQESYAKLEYKPEVDVNPKKFGKKLSQGFSSVLSLGTMQYAPKSRIVTYGVLAGLGFYSASQSDDDAGTYKKRAKQYKKIAKKLEEKQLASEMEEGEEGVEEESHSTEPQYVHIPLGTVETASFQDATPIEVEEIEDPASIPSEDNTGEVADSDISDVPMIGPNTCYSDLRGTQSKDCSCKKTNSCGVVSGYRPQVVGNSVLSQAGSAVQDLTNAMLNGDSQGFRRAANYLSKNKNEIDRLAKLFTDKADLESRKAGGKGVNRLKSDFLAGITPNNLNKKESNELPAGNALAGNSSLLKSGVKAEKFASAKGIVLPKYRSVGKKQSTDDFDFQSRKPASEVIAMNAVEPDYSNMKDQGLDKYSLNKDKGTSIFKFISARYMKSGIRKLR